MNSSFIGIPTLQLWKSHSSITGSRKAATKAVDKVVDAYEILLRQPKLSDESRLFGLLRIARKCCEWLIHKEQSPKSQRRPAIQKLLQNAIDEAIRLKPGLEIQRAKFQGSPKQILPEIRKCLLMVFLKKKLPVVTQRLAPFAGGKTLNPQQWTETIQVVDQHGAVRHLYGNVSLYEILSKFDPTPAGNYLEDYVRLVGKGFLTPEEAEEFKEVSKIIFDKIQSGELDIHKELQQFADYPPLTKLLGQGNLLIKYFTDADRKNAKLVAVRDGAETIFKYYARDTQLVQNYTTGHRTLSPIGDAYAASRYGAIYTVKYADYQGAPERIQHSSYMGGKAVLCAGMIRVEDGRLKHIDNGSGHYQPTTENLLSLLRILDEKDFNLNEVTTKDLNNKTIYFEGMENRSQIQLADDLREFSFNAKQFLDNNGIVMEKVRSERESDQCRIRALVDRKPSPDRPLQAVEELWKKGEFIKDGGSRDILLPCL